MNKLSYPRHHSVRGDPVRIVPSVSELSIRRGSMREIKAARCLGQSADALVIEAGAGMIFASVGRASVP